MKPGDPHEFVPAKISREGEAIYRLFLKGSDREMGLRRGRELKEDIRSKWAWMESFYDTGYGLPRAKWDEVAAKAEANSRRRFPWMADQMEGMAEGSGVSLRDILLMNYYGLVWASGNWCTSVAVRHTEEGPLLGQNLDIGYGDFYYMEEQQSKAAHPILSDMGLGLCCSPCGVNAEGLAVASSGLPAPGQAKRPWDWDGVPYQFLPRLVLRCCGSVAEAIEYLKGLPSTIPSGGGYQLSLLDASGAMAVVDKTGDRTVARQCEPDLNFTCNCAFDEEFELWRMGAPGSYPDGVARAVHIRQEWAALQGAQPTRDWLVGLMRGNTGPGALCRTNDKGYTRLSFVLSPVSRAMDIANGPPDRTPYAHATFRQPA